VCVRASVRGCGCGCARLAKRATVIVAVEFWVFGCGAFSISGFGAQGVHGYWGCRNLGCIWVLGYGVVGSQC